MRDAKLVDDFWIGIEEVLRIEIVKSEELLGEIVGLMKIFREKKRRRRVHFCEKSD